MTVLIRPLEAYRNINIKLLRDIHSLNSQLEYGQISDREYDRICRFHQSVADQAISRIFDRLTWSEQVEFCALNNCPPDLFDRLDLEQQSAVKIII